MRRRARRPSSTPDTRRRWPGLPIGKGTWVVDIGEKSFTAVASGMTSGLLKIFTGGKGTGSAHGTVRVAGS